MEPRWSSDGSWGNSGRLQCGREGERKERRNKGVEAQDLSRIYFTSNLECAGDNLSEHRLSGLLKHPVVTALDWGLGPVDRGTHRSQLFNEGDFIITHSRWALRNNGSVIRFITEVRWGNTQLLFCSCLK